MLRRMIASELRSRNLSAGHPCREFVFGNPQSVFCVQSCKKIDSSCNNTGPSGLMARAKTSTIVTVKILVEEDVVLPVRIFLKLLRPAIDRTLTVGITQKDA